MNSPSMSTRNRRPRHDDELTRKDRNPVSLESKAFKKTTQDTVGKARRLLPLVIILLSVTLIYGMCMAYQMEKHGGVGNQNQKNKKDGNSEGHDRSKEDAGADKHVQIIPKQMEIKVDVPSSVKASVIIMNYGRPDVLQSSKLLPTLTSHENIDEIFLLHANEETKFEYEHDKGESYKLTTLVNIELIVAFTSPQSTKYKRN